MAAHYSIDREADVPDLDDEAEFALEDARGSDSMIDPDREDFYSDLGRGGYVSGPEDFR